MSGLHETHATSEPRRSKRLKRSSSGLEAKVAEPPARRPKRKRGESARVARPPPTLLHGELGSESEDVIAPPPPARRAAAPAPPPAPVPVAWRRSAYRLRNRVVKESVPLWS